MQDKLEITKNALSKANSPQEVYSIIQSFVIEHIDSDRVSIFLFDKNTMTLHNPSQEKTEDISLIGSAGLLGLCVLEKKSTIYKYISSEKHYHPEIDNPYHLKLKGQILYPLMQNKHELIAVIRLSRSLQFKNNYNQKDIEILNSLEIFLITMLKNLQDEKTQTDEDINQIETQVKNDSTLIHENMLFLSNTVHDIRTPANSLYGFLELIEENIKDKRILEYIAHAKESASFINTLTDSILTQAKYQKECSETELSIVNSIKYFSSIANMFTANMSKKGIHYLIYIDPFMPKEIEIDSIKMKRVLSNLIGNAYKFTPKDKVITLSIIYNATKKSLYISIKDTGIGIAKENQENIFLSFQQAEESTAMQFGGTGLGLSISAKYVKDFATTLHLESNLGKGSNFYFTMPLKVINPTPSCSLFINREKYITILTNNPKSIHAKYIKKYLETLSFKPENIRISHEIDSKTNDVFCFEDILSKEVFTFCINHSIQIIAVEKTLFSIEAKRQYPDIKLISENTYYGESIYTLLSSKKKPRVMILDDNKMNVMLIEGILKKEDCEITSFIDSKKALDRLTQGLIHKQSYDVIFIDKHMPILSGIEVIKEYKRLEALYPPQKSMFIISITGDSTIPKQEKALYDMIVNKPFDKATIHHAFSQVIREP
ncbi:Probable sensor/response regulator hybrid [hydrothermal vent metagenome]|uniref:histidine kinase n=1 Tax=hydrothermal vent metagenome TaxID=652676 RepID=A0A1W1C6Q5_9ZZZZ